MKKIFWQEKWKDKTCGITQSRLRPGKNKDGIPYCIFLKCGHGFYRKVLVEWILNCPTEETTCPICRKVFSFFELF